VSIGARAGGEVGPSGVGTVALKLLVTSVPVAMRR